MIVIDINSPDFKKKTVIELKQCRGHLHKLLVESDAESESRAGVSEINKALHEELRAVQDAILLKENEMNIEAAAARSGNGVTHSVGYNSKHETAELVKPDESVRSYMQNRGWITDQYEGVTWGGTARSLVTGARTDGERRQLSEGSDSAGGVTVATAVSAQGIDLVRAKSSVVGLGARSLPVDTEKTIIPRLASDPTIGWRLENAPVATGDPTFDSVTIQARSLACIVKASRELLEDSVGIDQMLTDAFVGKFAAEIDRVCLVGSGTPPEPKGIANTDNVNSVDLQGADFDSFDKFIDAMVKIWQSNVQTVSGIVLSPANLGIVSKLKEAAPAGNQPLQKPAVLQAVPMVQTTNCPNDIGFVGDFSKLVLSFRSRLRIELLRELFAENLQFAFLCHLRFDCAVTVPGAFCTLDNVSLS